jgi:hypothetical protein
MKLTGENRSTRGKTCPSAALSTTNPTWTDPGSNPGLRGERPATNRLSHGTDCVSRLKGPIQVRDICVIFRNILGFNRRNFVHSAISQAGGGPSVGLPWLNIQYTGSYPPCLKTAPWGDSIHLWQRTQHNYSNTAVWLEVTTNVWNTGIDSLQSLSLINHLLWLVKRNYIFKGKAKAIPLQAWTGL